MMCVEELVTHTKSCCWDFLPSSCLSNLCYNPSIVYWLLAAHLAVWRFHDQRQWRNNQSQKGCSREEQSFFTVCAVATSYQERRHLQRKYLLRAITQVQRNWAVKKTLYGFVQYYLTIVFSVASLGTWHVAFGKTQGSI